jgi:hypothetical protein
MAVLRSASPKPTNRRVEPSKEEKPQSAAELEKPKTTKAFELMIAAAGNATYIQSSRNYQEEKLVRCLICTS